MAGKPHRLKSLTAPTFALAAALALLILIPLVGSQSSAYGEITLGNETYWLVPYSEINRSSTWIGNPRERKSARHFWFPKPQSGFVDTICFGKCLSSPRVFGIFYPDYSCTDTAFETSKVLTSGSHHPMFWFGSQYFYCLIKKEEPQS